MPQAIQLRRHIHYHVAHSSAQETPSSQKGVLGHLVKQDILRATVLTPFATNIAGLIYEYGTRHLDKFKPADGQTPIIRAWIEDTITHGRLARREITVPLGNQPRDGLMVISFDELKERNGPAVSLRIYRTSGIGTIPQPALDSILSFTRTTDENEGIPTIDTRLPFPKPPNKDVLITTTGQFIVDLNAEINTLLARAGIEERAIAMPKWLQPAPVTGRLPQRRIRRRRRPGPDRTPEQ